MVETSNDILIFDRAQRRMAHKRAAPYANNHNFLINWAHEQISDRLKDINREFEHVLKIENTGEHNFSLGNTRLTSDEEFFPIKDQSLDLITSILNLHSVNDLPGVLIQMKRALKPDGLLMAALFGGETLYELREALTQTEINLKGGVSPRVFPFADKQQMGALMQRAGFALPVVDSEIITVTYENMFKLMHDLRFMGEGNIIRNRDKTNPGKSFFLESAQYYADHFSDKEGRIQASFEIIFLIGWAPHKSQQQPLKPGSAKTRLSEALETQEVKVKS